AAGVELAGSPTLAAALRAVADYGRVHPRRSWLVGGGWNQEIWKLGRFPRAAELDKAEAARPVWLSRVDGHAGWANSRALKLAGITATTPDPSGGKILRDANGAPSGVLVDRAMNLVEAVLPPASEAERREALDDALAQLAKAGLTSVHDAGVGAAQDALYRDYATRGKLTVRVYGMIRDTGADFDALSRNGPLPSFAHDMYALRAVKLFADGALGSRGAALLAPYSDEPSASGLLFLTDAELRAKMDKAVKAGYQVNVHAIGDAANRQVLDAFAVMRKRYGDAGLRHRIEHAQVVALADIARFKALGVLPSMQPTHATSDSNMAEARIGA
ncbi:MAG TPA: amidohydrolase, partial [Janthinobacterium sp.]|nr:amidohydrolase [Janthinobacterium sp.]